MSPVTCSRCGRRLTAASSVARGTGRTCARRGREDEVTAEVSPRVVESAREIVELAAIVASGRCTRAGRPVFVVVSSTGADRYLTTERACTCPASTKRGLTCSHQVAARLVAA